MAIRSLLVKLLCLVAAAGPVALVIPSFSEQTDRFIGELELGDVDPRGKNFELAQPLTYIDPAGIRWHAEKGVVSHGASIPWRLWSIVGGPFDGEYRGAAVIHDFYCGRKYRAWQRTHRVFYDAMLTEGVDVIKAKLLYYAVWRFGPRWNVTEIVPCVPDPTIGKFCASLRPTSVELSEEKPVIEEEDVSAAKAELDWVANKISREGLSLEELEQLADSKPPPARMRVTIRTGMVQSITPLPKYEDFKLSETTTIVPDNLPILGLFPNAYP
jgi:hypothetical protein